MGSVVEASQRFDAKLISVESGETACSFLLVGIPMISQKAFLRSILKGGKTREIEK